MDKIVTKKKFKETIRPEMKKDNKTIALCHGVFDLVHPGHIIHFKQAKAMADILVVSITAAEFVRKGPGRPYFNDEMRLKFLEAIDCIDYVMLSEMYTVDDIIESVEPDYYVKGQEYANEDADITENIYLERELVEAHGGCVRYTGGEVFSSTKLINHGLSGLPEDVLAYMEEYKKSYSMQDILKYANRIARLRILVVGDVIIDKYTYCSVQGLMSKDMGYSARLKYSEEYLGGAVAIARHLASFSNEVTLLSGIGNEDEYYRKLTDGLRGIVFPELVRSSSFPTIVKQRYLVKNERREEYQKVFVINNIPESMHLDETAAKNFKKKIDAKIENYDVVFLCDFGHGLIDEESIEIIQRKAKFLVLNCQTNSSNYGLNVITKYHRADIFTVDQKELKIAFPAFAGDEDVGLQRLGLHLSGNGFLTRGSQGAYGYTQDDPKKITKCPALTLTVKDTIGAGDAFYAVSGAFAAVGAPIGISLFMGNVAGALGANIVGNKDSVEKVDALKYASTLLNV